MTQRHEIIDLLQEELQKYGLRGEVADRGKHLEFAWQASQGRRFVIVSRTASDWRAGMNTRSDMRKMLRADNVQLKQESTFQRAMSLPKEAYVTPQARDAALHKDVETLSELVLELHEQNSVLLNKLDELTTKLNSISVVSTVMSNVSFTGLAQVQQQPAVEELSEIKPLPKRVAVSSNEIVLDAVGHQWTAKSEIVRKASLNVGVVGQCLLRLRARGLVENGARGEWRRKSNVTSLFGS